MKARNLLLIISSVIVSVFLLCSCSRGSVRRAGDSMRDAARGVENFMDNGLNAVPNSAENGRNTVIGGTYGANSGYNANAGIGTTGSYTASGRATELNPTIGKKTNRGMINTNKGELDGGTR